MLRLYQLLHGCVMLCQRFDEQRHFAGGFTFTLPPVDRSAVRKDVDASRQPRFDQLLRERQGLSPVRKIGNDEYVFHRMTAFAACLREIANFTHFPRQLLRTPQCPLPPSGSAG